MYKTITSIHNPLVKQLKKLQEKSRERKKTGLFAIEGLREIQLAISAGYKIEHLLFVPEIIRLTKITDIFPSLSQQRIEITIEVYRKLAYRNSTEGIIAIAKTKNHRLSEIKSRPKNPLYLVAEAPEKPGNIGALLRTADAANVDAVFIANPTTDLYNPNVIRSSVGCVFTSQIFMGSTSEIITHLKKHNIAIYCAALKEDSKIYDTQNFTKATAIVVGTEAIGLTDEWLNSSTENIIIPMQGKIDSMNVSVSAGILIFEAIRQRNL